MSDPRPARRFVAALWCGLACLVVALGVYLLGGHGAEPLTGQRVPQSGAATSERLGGSRAPSSAPANGSPAPPGARDRAQAPEGPPHRASPPNRADAGGGWTIWGDVRDAISGEPIPGAIVEIHPSGLSLVPLDGFIAEGRTASDGRFEFDARPVPAGTRADVVARCRGYLRTGVPAVSVVPPRHAVGTIFMRRGGAIEGVVVTPSGRPVGSAEVSAVPDDLDSAGVDFHPERGPETAHGTHVSGLAQAIGALVVTDADGRFVARPLPPGVPYTLHARLCGRVLPVTELAGVVAPSSGTRLVVPEVAVVRIRTIRGPRAKPSESCVVWVNNIDEAAGMAESREFALGGEAEICVLPGEYQLMLSTQQDDLEIPPFPLAAGEIKLVEWQPERPELRSLTLELAPAAGDRPAATRVWAWASGVDGGPARSISVALQATECLLSEVPWEANEVVVLTVDASGSASTFVSSLTPDAPPQGSHPVRAIQPATLDLRLAASGAYSIEIHRDEGPTPCLSSGQDDPLAPAREHRFSAVGPCALALRALMPGSYVVSWSPDSGESRSTSERRAQLSPGDRVRVDIP